MLQSWVIIVSSLAYIGMLFAIAYYGDRHTKKNKAIPYRGIVYSLSLAIYCTSWTYYGAVGSAATNGWNFFAIYLGPIILIILGFQFYKKLATVCIANNVTSIADFIASRYGKSQGLAVLVTVIAILGTLPYIALQLKAVASSYTVLSSVDVLNLTATTSSSTDTALILTIVLALFSILFGTRYVNASEHHEGLILAVAFESIVKLVALILVCIFAIYSVFEGPSDLLLKISNSPQLQELQLASIDTADFIKTSFMGQLVLAMAAIFCLPRQFHVAFVEIGSIAHLRTMRWIFPIYLAITSMVIVPITFAGVYLFTGFDVSPDMFVLTIPLFFDNNFLALLVFIGGFSAATGMVIVAVIALSTMVCNDIVMPIIFKVPAFDFDKRGDIGKTLLLIRRLSIITILFLSYAYYRYISDYEALASIGLIAFVAAIQFAPAIIGGVYWKHGSRRGAVTGLSVGLGLWLYTLFLPALGGSSWMSEGLIESGPWGLCFLKPYALMGLDQFDPITHGLIWSLTLNVVCYVFFSLSSKPDLLERIQAANFTQTASAENAHQDLPWWSSVAVGDLRLLAEKFIGESAAKKAFAEYTQANISELNASEDADADLIKFTERLLAGAIGSSSARLIISSVLKQKKDLPIEDVFSIVDEVSQALQFSQELLMSTIEHIDQGISVVDENLRLVAWNSRYLEIYDYPSGMIKIGRSIADVIRFNAHAGECGPGVVEDQVEKRLNHMRSGSKHSFLRHRSDGSVLQIQGRPMPGGGFVMSFTDITEYKKNEKELREINENLESIVAGRTQELSMVNRQLELANETKNKFLAAVNHDVMQPINAARLFTSALAQTDPQSRQLTDRIASSLRSAEEIIHTLLDVSKLDSGSIKPNFNVFDIDIVLSTLEQEFSVIAAEKDIELKIVRSHVLVKSDKHLLRRILQNFISNALRYTPTNGRVMIGCRRMKQELSVQVVDTGVGMNKDDLQIIFEEFKQLENELEQPDKGVGLGLSIAQRISGIVKHPIEVKSQLGKGSTFSVSVPIAKQTEVVRTRSSVVESGVLQIDQSIVGLNVLCIDNDKDVLDAMKAILQVWGCQVSCVRSYDQAQSVISENEYKPDVLLVDYHLDQDVKGMDVMDQLRKILQKSVTGVLITADVEDSVRETAVSRGYEYLRKPVNPGRLRKLLMRTLKAQATR